MKHTKSCRRNTSRAYQEAKYGKNTGASAFLSLVAALGLMLAGEHSVQATTIVGGVTASRITVAADTKMVAVSRLSPGEQSSVCKIHQLDHMFFAVAGLLAISQSHFDLVELIGRSRVSGEPIKATVGRFTEAYKFELSKELEEVGKRNPELLRSEMLRSSFESEAVFFGFENGAPVVYIRRFKASFDSAAAIKVNLDGSANFDSQPIAPNAYLYFGMGMHQEADQYAAEHRSEITPERMSQSLDELVRLEASKYPRIVGLPADVIEITSTGARWVAGGPERPEIRSY